MNYFLKHERISGDLECYGLYKHSLTHHSISRNSLHIFIIIKFVQNIGSYLVCSHMQWGLGTLNSLQIFLFFKLTLWDSNHFILGVRMQMVHTSATCIPVMEQEGYHTLKNTSRYCFQKNTFKNTFYWFGIKTHLFETFTNHKLFVCVWEWFNWISHLALYK